MIREMQNAAGVVAVVGTEPTDEPFGFTAYAAIASARDHLGPVVVHARHLPYGVWWDRLRSTVELVRQGPVPDHPLDLGGIWCDGGRFIAAGSEHYAAAAAPYRCGDGLF